MTEPLRTSRIPLSTGISLNVQQGGPEDSEAIILLHGFPESHRTWREVAPVLARRFRVVAPDQRGFAGSDRPQEVEAYRIGSVLDDLIALADALGIARFTLVGHDWGGAVAWAAALRHSDRIDRLIIVNAPHPLIFQKSLIEDPAQRAASQYINALRSPGAETGIQAMGLDRFLERIFAGSATMPENERKTMLGQWGEEGALTAMFNWYRASEIEVPAPGEQARLPQWTKAPFPSVRIPTLVLWAMDDRALLPVQLDGLDELVDDLRIIAIPGCGHFAPWSCPEAVIEGLSDFIARTPIPALNGRPR